MASRLGPSGARGKERGPAGGGSGPAEAATDGRARPVSLARWLAGVGAGVLVFVAGALGIAIVATSTPLLPWTVTVLYAVAAAGAVTSAWFVLRRPAGAAPVAAPLERFQVDGVDGRRVIRAADLEWIEAAGNYARLHHAGDGYLYRVPLARLERELDPARFLRVHRSAIVNLDAVARVVPLPSGDALLHLKSGAELRLSRRYARRFHAKTGRGV